MFRKCCLPAVLGLAVVLGSAAPADARPPSHSPRYGYALQYDVTLENFIEGLYLNVMGRHSEPHEMAHWIDRMIVLRTRAQMADEFIQNWNTWLEVYGTTAQPGTPGGRYIAHPPRHRDRFD